jgi:hypothetical protein
MPPSFTNSFLIGMLRNIENVFEKVLVIVDVGYLWESLFDSF